MTLTDSDSSSPSGPHDRRNRRDGRDGSEPCGQRYDAVVLAGGGARRLGGADKPAVTIGGRPLLDRVLSACTDACATVVVGPRRPTYRAVRWTREEPRGGGPLAALSAGLRHTTSETVLVLSADLPFLRAATVRTLLAAAGGQREEDGAELAQVAGEEAGGGANAKEAVEGEVEGALVNDGRDQPLLAAYRAEPLRRELALLHTEYGSLSGLPLRLLLPQLRLRRVSVSASTRNAGTTQTSQAAENTEHAENVGDTADPSDALDCDTWDDVAAARARIREHGTVLDEWMTAVKAELGIELDVDTAALLDLARDAAHGVARPAAPLTTFLVGYAAAARGGSAADVAEAARKAADLAARWAAEEEKDGDGSDG